MSEQTITEAAAYAAANQFLRRFPVEFCEERFQHILAQLCEEQQRRLDAGQPVSAIPLTWAALAESMRLKVDITGRIIDGPREQVVTIPAVEVIG